MHKSNKPVKRTRELHVNSYSERWGMQKKSLQQISEKGCWISAAHHGKFVTKSPHSAKPWSLAFGNTCNQSAHKQALAFLMILKRASTPKCRQQARLLKITKNAHLKVRKRSLSHPSDDGSLFKLQWQHEYVRDPAATMYRSPLQQQATLGGHLCTFVDPVLPSQPSLREKKHNNQT